MVSGNNTDGLHFDNGTATSNLIEGNYFGTDRTGESALGNGQNGVQFFGGSSAATFNTIGGTTPGSGNVMSANGNDGVSYFLSSTSNTFEGNYMGTDAIGTIAIPNAI